MARKRSTPPRQLSHHWYLREWGEVLGKSQADATRDLDWPKAKASDLWTGKQRYTQDLVDEVATWFNIRPYELLMHPADAMALRQMRDAVARLAVANSETSRTGTTG